MRAHAGGVLFAFCLDPGWRSKAKRDTGASERGRYRLLACGVSLLLAVMLELGRFLFEQGSAMMMMMMIIAARLLAVHGPRGLLVCRFVSQGLPDYFFSFEFVLVVRFALLDACVPVV